MDPDDDNRAIVRRFVEDVLNTGNADAADALLAPTYRVHSPYQGLRDRTAFKEWLTTFRATFPDARWTIVDAVAEGDKVAVRLTFEATHTREFMGVAPTGRRLSATEYHTFRLDGGMLAEQWALPDNLTLLRQIGALPPIHEQPPTPGEVRMPPGAAQAERFDKFTERARKVLTLAQEEATRFNHNYIGTEHLLLGLVREGDGVAAKVLSNLGADLNKVRSAVEFIIGRGDRMLVGEIGLTPRAKKVIELAVDEARRLGHHYIGTEHLLLGLVREGEGIAAGVLESLGVSLEKVRAQTVEVLSSSLGSHAGLASPEAPGNPPQWRAVSSPTVERPTAGGRRQQWEYLTAWLTYPEPDGDSVVARIDDQADSPRLGDAPLPLPDALRILGADGWELVGIDTAAGGTPRQARYVFKRPAMPPAEEGT